MDDASLLRDEIQIDLNPDESLFANIFSERYQNENLLSSIT
jgi:hypothetical protein